MQGRTNHAPESECSPEDNLDERNLAREALRSAAKPWYENALWIWAFQGIIAAAIVLLLGYVVFWMDAHNDLRYIRKPDYDKDNQAFVERYKDNRDNDRKDREAIRQVQIQDKIDLNKRLDRQELQLDTIANDIKALLRTNK